MTSAIRTDLAAARWSRMEGNDPGDEADIEDCLETDKKECLQIAAKELPEISLQNILEAYRYKGLGRW